MELKDALNVVSQTAKELGTSTPYICGGTPRDKVMGRPMSIEDIDITTGDQSVKILARGVAQKIRGPGINFKEMGDGHSQLTMPGLKLDFSTNYIQPGVKNMLVKAGLANPTPMQLELYSRDFTCNALLMTLDLKKIVDPIGLGIKDIRERVLRTCLPAKITLGSDPKRVVRVIYMAAKLGFRVDDEIVRWVKENPAALVPPGRENYVTDKINEALKYDPSITVRLMDRLGLWRYAPVSDQLLPYMSHNVGRI
jgi:tRNA nucleotidyltransferase/poly(A) polymerase